MTMSWWLAASAIIARCLGSVVTKVYLYVNADPWLFADPVDDDRGMFNTMGFHIPIAGSLFNYLPFVLFASTKKAENLKILLTATMKNCTKRISEDQQKRCGIV
eukprot:GFUD01052691.1.p1 GENE.GFUD01052691.1~~GFUD01052691.1.p1  ORF type:complete len:104 (-),score=3.50 GFUD01052691.1:466-777(-)